MKLAQAYLNISSRVPVSDIGIKNRLDRAYDIVNSYGYSVNQDLENPNIWHVVKASTSLLDTTPTEYFVNTDDKTCTCPDFPTARGGLCKHRLAVLLTIEMQKEA